MTSNFIGRERELKALNAAYALAESQFFPIYGRRRVGKSELIAQFMKDKAGIYYVGKRAPADIQRKEFMGEVARCLEDPILSELSVNDWKTCLSTAVDRWERKGKLILVLDEFQWICGASPELPSVIQDCWDKTWSKSGNLFLILCGSYIGFMERMVLGRKSPLYGRRTGQVHLHSFNYQSAGEFHPNYSLIDKARTYFICGGIPLYLKCFDSKKSVERNIQDVLMDEFAPLYGEPAFLLREELREVENYYAILLSVASGQTRHQDIARFAGMKPASLHYYLEQLVVLGYLARRFPLTSKKPNPRDVRYVLDDPLIRFWFRFIYPNNSYILRARAKDAFNARVEPQLQSYFGSCFERLCREALPFLYLEEGVQATFEVGEYWSADSQIDVIGLRDDGWTDLGECKWSTRIHAKQVERELDMKVSSYPNPKNATIGKRIFTEQSRPEAASDRVVWHSLEDMYVAVRQNERSE